MSNLNTYEISNEITLTVEDIEEAVKDYYGHSIATKASKRVLEHLMNKWDAQDDEDIDGNIITALDYLCDKGIIVKEEDTFIL